MQLNSLIPSSGYEVTITNSLTTDFRIGSVLSSTVAKQKFQNFPLNSLIPSSGYDVAITKGLTTSTLG
jgi:hypothetical protein